MMGLRKKLDVKKYSEQVYNNVYLGQSREFYYLLGSVVFLAGFGIVMVLSSSSVNSVKNGESVWSELWTQAGAFLMGMVLLSVVANLKTETVKKLVPLGVLFGLLLQLTVAFTPLGATINGNRSWMRIGLVSFQPVEFVKVALILYLAKYLSDRNQYSPHQREFWIPPFVLFGIFGLLIAWLGGDFGSMIIIGTTIFGMLFFTPLQMSTLKRLLFVGFVGLILAILGLGGTRRARIFAWAMPWQPDPAQYNWQVEHARWAFASGGITGQGLGKSQMKWSWLPEAQNDFIFAIIGEELGLLGTLVTLACFVFLGVTLLRIARKTDDIYKQFVVYGVTSWIMIQTFINIAVVLGLLPVLGVPLPLISAGGSSMLATLIAVGVVLGIERSNSATAPKLRVIRGGRR